jgi:RNA polymerase sigma-70 factor (ECF subfamily)
MDSLILDEQKRALYKALSTLSEEMRIIVYLIYFENMSYDEAAQVMKKSKKQVDNLLYRAKNQLRTILTDNGEDI